MTDANPVANPVASILIPTLNEESTISETISSIPATLRACCQILVIDGLSTDATIDEAKRKDLYYKAQKRIVDQVYWMPFFVQHEIQGANKHFQYDLGVDQIPRWQYGTWKE